MSWGVALGNAVSLGLGGIATLLSAPNRGLRGDGFLLAEDGSFLIQEDNFRIFL